MKKKKFLVLLLTFIMVFALAACGGDKDDDDDKKSGKESLDGTWCYEYDASEMMAAELGTEDVDFSINLYCAFNEDEKTMEMYLDKDEFSKQLEDFMVDYMYNEFENTYGYSRSEADDLVEEKYGYDVKGYVSSLIPEAMDKMGDQFSMSGYYKTKGDKLYMSEEEDEFDDDDYVIFEIDGKTLTLDDPNGSDSISNLDIDIPLPMKFKKVK